MFEVFLYQYFKFFNLGQFRYSHMICIWVCDYLDELIFMRMNLSLDGVELGRSLPPKFGDNVSEEFNSLVGDVGDLVLFWRSIWKHSCSRQRCCFSIWRVAAICLVSSIASACCLCINAVSCWIWCFSATICSSSAACWRFEFTSWVQSDCSSMVYRLSSALSWLWRSSTYLRSSRLSVWVAVVVRWCASAASLFVLSSWFSSVSWWISCRAVVQRIVFCSLSSSIRLLRSTNSTYLVM